MPPQITCACALPGKIGKNKLHFSLKYCRPISALAELNQSMLDFFNLFWLTTHVGVWFPKSYNQCVQLGAVGAWFRRKKSTAMQQLDCVACTMHQFSVSCFTR